MYKRVVYSSTALCNACIGGSLYKPIAISPARESKAAMTKDIERPKEASGPTAKPEINHDIAITAQQTPMIHPCESLSAAFEYKVNKLA